MTSDKETIEGSAMELDKVSAMMTDLYQLTMCYAYFKAGKHKQPATFELFFRKNPFGGEFTVFAGLAECVQLLKSFKFTENDVQYLRSVLHVDANDGDEFFTYLSTVTADSVELWSVPEGCVVFPRVPLLVIKGPLAVCQLLETALINLINFASLVTTNAARFRLAAPKAQLLEFGLRRAQGPNGAFTASKYCYAGGFDATSNVLAGQLCNIPVRGTHAHAFVSAFDGDSNEQHSLPPDARSLLVSARVWLERMSVDSALGVGEHIDSELLAFCSYAAAFPSAFLALVDTYDTLKSGIINFVACALALHEVTGNKAVGVRLDSGDLAYQSRQVRSILHKAANTFSCAWLAECQIVASNDINEETLHALCEQEHSIDAFGIGTHLVTCQKQPALGCVYKLVELNGVPRMKLSNNAEKLTVPGRKTAYRLYGKDGRMIADLLCEQNECAPGTDTHVLIRHPFVENKRVLVKPSRVQPLHNLYYSEGNTQQSLQTLTQIRDTVWKCIGELREDHIRYVNPTPYKVSLSEKLYAFLHRMWLDHTPIATLE